MVYGKAQIAFSAAKIVYPQNAFCREILLHGANVLKKTVDLAEFRLLFIVYPAVFIRNAERNQEWLVAIQNVILSPIQGLRECFGEILSVQGAKDFVSPQEHGRALLVLTVFRISHGGDDIDLPVAVAQSVDLLP